MTSQLLTETETAAVLRLKIKTLQAWRQLKRGPRFVRLGRRIFYPHAEVECFIQAQLVETQSFLPVRAARNDV